MAGDPRGLPEAARQGAQVFDMEVSLVLSDDRVEIRRIEITPRGGWVKPDDHEVRSILSSLRFLDLDPEAMRIPSNPGQTILGDRGENLSSVLQAICNDPARKTSLLEWIRALTPLDAADLTFESDFTGRILVHLVEANGAKLSAASVSDGTLRFLAMVAALLSEDTGKIYVFEELDNGIHPTRLDLLLELIDRACAEQGVQVIATSHNPAMLAFLGERARADALLIYRGEDHTSHVRRVMDLPNIAEILRTQDLSRLMLSGWLEDAAGALHEILRTRLHP